LRERGRRAVRGGFGALRRWRAVPHLVWPTTAAAIGGADGGSKCDGPAGTLSSQPPGPCRAVQRRDGRRTRRGRGHAGDASSIPADHGRSRGSPPTT
jgi:hypothetical protein